MRAEKESKMRNLENLLQAMITSKFRYVVAVFTTALLCAWHAGEAQVVKGSTPAATAQPSAAQLHEHLRAAHGQGRTSPMIANPRASQLDNSSIIVVCRNQKQNADREVLEMRAALGSIGGSGGKAGRSNPQQLTITGNTKGPSGQAGAPAGDIITGNTKGPSGQIGGAGAAGGNNALTITGNTKGPSGQAAAPAGAAPGGKAAGPSGNLPAVMRTDTKIAAGAGGGPQLQGPMKTESASGPQTPGSATSANVMGGPCPQPKIQTISGFPMAIFTPGPLFSPYTIKGCGFGWQMGKVYLTGAFNAGKIPLQVQMTGGSQKAPARASWTDTLIIVSLDPNLSGELDQTNVTLVVEPVSGPPITKPSNDFLAAREVLELATIPQSKVQFTQSAPISKGVVSTAPSVVYGPNPPGFQLLYFTPSSIPTGMSAEVFRGGTTVFFPDGYDYYDLHPLAPGFFVNTFQLHYDPDPTNCDADTAGSRGSWSATFDSKDNIRVSWKEVRCHQAWMGGYPDVWSEYSLNVFVKGPRGIDPWTGKRLLSAIVPAVQRAH
jgi:hypothetical protein